MSNRIDLYQPEHEELSLSAANVAIFVDGVTAPELSVRHIVRAGWPDFSYARIACNVEKSIMPGAQVCIGLYYDASPPDSIINTYPIFIGRVETINKDLSQNNWQIEFTARDYSAYFERKTVYGQYVTDTEGLTQFLSGADTIFNEDVKPNALETLIDVSDTKSRAFAADLSSSVYWSYAQIIDYLLSRYASTFALVKPQLDSLVALTDNQRAVELDLTGMSLLKALQRCCEAIAVSFKFEPVNTPSGLTQAIVFYKAGAGRSVQLNLQQAGQRLSVSKTNVAKYSSRMNFWPVTHRYIGNGDVKVFEATFDLVGAWDTALETTNYDTFAASTNDQFHRVRNVYRKWCLNEAGQYSGQPYNLGQAYDLSLILGTSSYVRRRRRFHPALTCDKQGRSLGYCLEVTYDDGEYWRPYHCAFDNLLNECGIWLSSDHLDVETWIAALKGVLKFRITASIVSDERLSCEMADGPIGSAVPVIDHVIHQPRSFAYRKVIPQSQFYHSEDESLGNPNEADDSSTLYQYVRKWARDKSEVIETVDLQSPYLALHYSPGDKVTADQQSRDMLGLVNDNRSTCHIEKVRMDFENQSTDLKIIRKRQSQL